MAGVELTTKIEGFDELANSFKQSPSVVDEITIKMLKMSAMIVQAEAKEKAPVDTSILRKSINYEVSGTQGNRFARVGTNVPYAVYQEFGTGVYGPKGTPITPKRAKMLAFRTKSGDLVFAKQVRGIQPKKFMLSGIEKLRENIDKVLELGKKLSQSLVK